MGTQAVVSILAPDAMSGKDRVIVKAVCGCNGYQADLLADEILRANASNADQVLELAKQVGFGCKDCLIVMDLHGYRSDSDCLDDGLSPLYRETFDDPNFNPRWKHGTADFVRLVKFPNWKTQPLQVTT